MIRSVQSMMTTQRAVVNHVIGGLKRVKHIDILKQFDSEIMLLVIQKLNAPDQNVNWVTAR